MSHEDLRARFAAFGWNVTDVADGNDVNQLNAAFDAAEQFRGKPTLIIAHTVKGKGASIMENKASWHHHLPNAEEYAAITRELQERKEALKHE